MMIVRNVMSMWLLTTAVSSAAFVPSYRNAALIRSRSNMQNGVGCSRVSFARMATVGSDSSDPNIQDAEIESTEPVIESVSPEAAGETMFTMEAAEPEAEKPVMEAIEPESEAPQLMLEPESEAPKMGAPELIFEEPVRELPPAAEPTDEDDSKMDRITKLWWQGTRFKKSDALALPPVVTDFAPGVKSSRTVYMKPDPTEPFEWKWVKEQHRFIDRL